MYCSVSHHQRSYAVDGHDSDRFAAHGFERAVAFGSESVACRPVSVHCRAEKSHGIIYGAHGEQAWSHSESRTNQWSKHCYATVREVGRTHACHFPSECFGSTQSELMRQKSILTAQTRRVGIAAGISVEKSALAEKKSFHSQLRVGMLAYEHKRHTHGQTFERLTVDAESKTAGHTDVDSLFPVASEAAAHFFESFGLCIKTFESEGRHPVGNIYRGHILYSSRTWDIAVGGSYQSAIFKMQIGWAWHSHLRYYLAVGPAYDGVVAVYDMKHHRIVCPVGRMAVTMPVACSEMYLHVACPYTSVDAYLGVEEVGTGIVVEPSRIDDLKASSVDGAHIVLPPQTMLPYILHQFFHR